MMSSETWGKVVKEGWAKGIDCEARELKAQTRDQAEVSDPLGDGNAWEGERQELRPRLQDSICL